MCFAENEEYFNASQTRIRCTTRHCNLRLQQNASSERVWRSVIYSFVLRAKRAAAGPCGLVKRTCFVSRPCSFCNFKQTSVDLTLNTFVNGESIRTKLVRHVTGYIVYFAVYDARYFVFEREWREMKLNESGR